MAASRWFGLLGLFCLLVMLSLNLTAVAEPKSEEPFKEHLAVKEFLYSLKHLEAMKMEISTKSSFSNNEDSSHDTKESEDIIVNSYHDLLYLMNRSRSDSPNGFWSLHQEFIIDKEESWYFQIALNNKMEPIFNDDSSISLNNDKLAGRPVKKTPLSVLNGLNQSAIVLGVLNYVPVKDHFSNLTEIAEVKEKGLVKIQSKSKYGDLELWLDPNYGYLPRKLKLLISGSQITNKKKINDWYMNGGGVFPAGGIKKILINIDGIEFDNYKGKFFMKKIVMDKKLFTSAGPVVNTVCDINVQKVIFNPFFKEYDFRTILEIPNGQDVSVEGSNNSYMWFDGKAVLKP